MLDTEAKAGAVQMRAIRAMPPCRRLALAAGWSTSLRGMVLAGLRRQHPEAPESHLRFLLAERCHGKQAATRAYGKKSAHG